MTELQEERPSIDTLGEMRIFTWAAAKYLMLCVHPFLLVQSLSHDLSGGVVATQVSAYSVDTFSCFFSNIDRIDK